MSQFEIIQESRFFLSREIHPNKFATKGKHAVEQTQDEFQEILEASGLLKRLRHIN